MFLRLKLRLRALLHRSDVGEEIELHIERLADELVAQGFSPAAARLAAIRQFGNTAQIQERSHDLFSFGLLEDLWRDVQHAGRAFRRAPGSAFAVMVLLALGMGGVTTLFGPLYSLVLRPLPFPPLRAVGAEQIRRAAG